MFKDNAIENKRKKNLEKKQRLNVISLRNKFLGEWASTVLGFDQNRKIKYINKISGPELKKDNEKLVIKKIEKDFINNNIKISYNEIELKVKDFQIKANIIVENEFKLNNWQ